MSYDRGNKVWSGPKYDPIYNTNVSLGYLILNVLKKTPELVTQMSADTNIEITCHEMRQRIMKISTQLAASGLQQGDVVGIMASNSENLASIVFACFTLGLPINPLAPVMVEIDVIQMYSKTKPKIIVCDSSVVQTVQSAVDKIKIRPVIYTLMKRVDGYKFVDDLLDVDFDEKNFV
jgi:4-coumarate--CoA ligase